MQGFLAQKYSVKHCFPPSRSWWLPALEGRDQVGFPLRRRVCDAGERFSRTARWFLPWDWGTGTTHQVLETLKEEGLQGGDTGVPLAGVGHRARGPWQDNGCETWPWGVGGGWWGPWGSPGWLCWPEEPWTEDGSLGTGVYNTGGRMVLTGDCKGSMPSLPTSLRHWPSPMKSA